jgi:glutamine---fructose-6-phosphate transaminase (isomerizing)
LTRRKPIEQLGGWLPGRHVRNGRGSNQSGDALTEARPRAFLQHDFKTLRSNLQTKVDETPARSRAFSFSGRTIIPGVVRVDAGRRPRRFDNSMCGIFGYIGETIDLAPTILNALRQLEYRGYDSWGLAVGVNGRLEVRKSSGRIGDASVDLPESSIGFGHTRWATHGRVTDANAHPHIDCSGQIAVIHNGIIENFRELREELKSSGHLFRSDTDSEVVAHMLEEQSQAPGGLTVETFRNVFQRLQGLSAIIALDYRSKTMYAAKNVSPLVFGAGESGFTIASDPVVLRNRADRLLYLEDDQVARISEHGVCLFDGKSLHLIQPTWQSHSLETRDTGLHGHQDFMSKEMAEQPDVLERIVQTANGGIEAMADAIADSYGTFLVGCGSASYAALTGSYLFSRIARRHVNFVVGSEFIYHEHFLTDKSLVIALSQSGETADIIEAMLKSKERGSRVAALVNVPNSTLDRMVDLRIHLGAGPEQCVLSTKAYTAKVAVLTMLTHTLAGTPERGRELVLGAADSLRSMLNPEWIGTVRSIAERIQHTSSLFVIGRGLSYPTALEAALKIKEVSYIHAEGFAGGELKHGVIALVGEGTPCVVYAPNDETRHDVLSGAMEMRSRGGYIIGVGSQEDPVFEAFIRVPNAGDAAPIVQALPAQMLGYHAALLRGNDPDKPRNLAKSVTVK